MFKYFIFVMFSIHRKRNNKYQHNVIREDFPYKFIRPFEICIDHIKLKYKSKNPFFHFLYTELNNVSNIYLIKDIHEHSVITCVLLSVFNNIYFKKQVIKCYIKKL